jgi:hypothetical protein
MWLIAAEFPADASPALPSRHPQAPSLLPGLSLLPSSPLCMQAKLLRDVDSVVAVVITLKTHYPKVDIAGIIKRKPRLLLSNQQRVQEDAQKVGTQTWEQLSGGELGTCRAP